MGGTDKPSLRVDGRRLLDVALEALAGARRRVVVAASANLPAGVGLVSEDPPERVRSRRSPPAWPR
jgi:molybdopterin-guanine dinucleotide biosynthesis protein A